MYVILHFQQFLRVDPLNFSKCDILFTLLFNWHNSNCQNHLVHLKMANLRGHDKWSYPFLLYSLTDTDLIVRMIFNHHFDQLKMAISSGHNKWSCTNLFLCLFFQASDSKNLLICQSWFDSTFLVSFASNAN